MKKASYLALNVKHGFGADVICHYSKHLVDMIAHYVTDAHTIAAAVWPDIF